MPNKFTFQIKPIKEILSRYVGDGIGWIDLSCTYNYPEYRIESRQDTSKA